MGEVDIIPLVISFSFFFKEKKNHKLYFFFFEGWYKHSEILSYYINNFCFIQYI